MKKKASPAQLPPIGTHFGKTDLERVGYFAELGYLHGRGYTPPVTIPQIRGPKNRQMLPEFPKMKTGLQDCYFDKSFKRLFIGEAFFDPIKHAYKERLEERKKINRLFRPNSFTHLQSGRGDFFGCFTTSMRAFDPRARPVAKVVDSKDAKKKFLQFIPTSPGKKGGYGYKDITINPYPKYIETPYDIKADVKKMDPNQKTVRWLPTSPPSLFQSHYPSDTGYIRQVPAFWTMFGVFKPPNPAKSLGGCMDGCFDKWPKHSKEFYIDPWKIQRGKTKQGPKPKKERERAQVWLPNGTGKTTFTTSVLQKKVYISTNSRTWKTMKPVTYTREFI